MGDRSGCNTPDSGLWSQDNSSRHSSVSSMDESNGLQGPRSSIDSGIGETKIMGDRSGCYTPDSGMGSLDNMSTRSSVSSTNQSNGLQGPRSSIDSGIGGIMTNLSDRSGCNTPDSGIGSLDNMSRRSSVSSTDESNGLQGRRSSTDSGIGGILKKNLSESNSRSKQPSTAQNIQVFATGPNSKTIPLNINTSDSTDKLIRHVSRAFGLGSGDTTYLAYDGKRLNLGSTETVEKAGIRNGSQMQVCTRVVGG